MYSDNFPIRFPQNGAEVIHTIRPSATIKAMKGFGKHIIYKGNAQNALLHHFNCTEKLSRNQSLNGIHSDAAIVSKALLFFPEDISKVKKHFFQDVHCSKHEVEPLKLYHSEKVGLDLEHARVDRKTFWALPVIKLNPVESMLWSKVLFQTLEAAHETLLISQVQVVPSIDIIESPYFEVKSMISKILKDDNSTSHKSLLSSSSTLYNILQKVIKTLGLSTSTQSELVSWIAYLETSAKQKTTSLAHRNSSSRGLHMKNRDLIQQLYNKTCYSYGAHIKVSDPWIQFRSIVLVVLFNFPHYEIIPYYELLYRPFFPQIVYCLPKGGNRTVIERYNLDITIVEYDNIPGWGFTNYICVHHTHKLGLNAEGYMFAADDTFLSLSLFKNLPFQKPATVHHLPIFCELHNTPSNTCKLWPHLAHAEYELRSLYREYERKKNSLPHKCLRVLQHISGLKEPLTSEPADIYYIPDSFMADASALFEAHYKHKVFLEVAIPHVLACLSYPAYPIHLNGIQEGSRDRLNFYKFIPAITTDRHEYLHPFKLSYVKKHEKEFVKSFCQSVIPYLHNGF